MEKLEMEYGLFICTIITYLMLWIRLRKELENTNTLQLSNEVLLSETKLNHVNTKAIRIYLLVKKTDK